MEENLKSALKALTGFGSERMEDVGVLGFMFVLMASLVSAIVAAHLYGYFYSSRSSGSQIHRAFPLLGVSVTAIFVTIQFSLPLSLGLLGALSIVRFRTPIKEPEEIGFLMLVIATSLCCATFNFLFVALLLGVATVALFLSKAGILHKSHDDCVLLVSLPVEKHAVLHPKILDHLEGTTRNRTVESVSKSDEQTVVSYSFKGFRAKSLAQFQSGLDEILEGLGYDLFINQQRVA